jgi:Undecaprenyl-phosphate galactose phosphotransferase WbaP
MPGIPRKRLMEILEECGQVFSHLVIIPDLFGVSSLWVTPQDYRGMLGLEVRNNLLRPSSQIIKRAIDVTVALVASVVCLPIMLAVALLIKLDSPGTVLYRQQRIGLDGSHFEVFKFRTMFGDGESRLAELLAQDASAKHEYIQFHKLRADPRVTKIGRWLRASSLDELPQLWNVWLGQMSVVGPRPYLIREIASMEGAEHIILRTRPGMTGLWQVSGRSNTTFKERLITDIYYVRNWSPWLDLYLLTRTVWAVLWRSGAR